jgi:copper chaperone CopZ
MRALRFFTAAAILTVVVVPTGRAAADDQSGKAEQVTYRVLGLFSADREKDLRAAFEDLPGLKLVSVNFDDAEITVEFFPGKAFPGSTPEQLVERFDQKLRSVTHHTFGVKPRRAVPRDKLEKVVIPVAGLDCNGCALAAYEAVAGIDGVEQAVASFKEGRVTAMIDPTKTDRVKLEDALRKKGVQLGKP